jgi:hypothetical protein
MLIRILPKIDYSKKDKDLLKEVLNKIQLDDPKGYKESRYFFDKVNDISIFNDPYQLLNFGKKK